MRRSGGSPCNRTRGDFQRGGRSAGHALRGSRPAGRRLRALTRRERQGRGHDGARLCLDRDEYRIRSCASAAAVPARGVRDDRVRGRRESTSVHHRFSEGDGRSPLGCADKRPERVAPAVWRVQHAFAWYGPRWIRRHHRRLVRCVRRQEFIQTQVESPFTCPWTVFEWTRWVSSACSYGPGVPQDRPAICRGDGGAEIIVSPNPSSQPRSMILQIGERPLTVDQAGR